jgi:hypothetical protein
LSIPRAVQTAWIPVPKFEFIIAPAHGGNSRGLFPLLNHPAIPVYRLLLDTTVVTKFAPAVHQVGKVSL